MSNDNHIEQAAGEALLDCGVSLPLFRFRIPFTRKKIALFRVVMRRPYLGSLVALSTAYLSLGTTYDKMKKFTKHEELEFMAKHGKTVAKMIAYTICRNGFTYRLSPVIAWLLLWFAPYECLWAANIHFAGLVGVHPFLNIIKSAEIVNPMKPTLSQRKEIRKRS